MSIEDIREAYHDALTDPGKTHYRDCHLAHPVCAIRYLLDCVDEANARAKRQKNKRKVAQRAARRNHADQEELASLRRLVKG